MEVTSSVYYFTKLCNIQGCIIWLPLSVLWKWNTLTIEVGWGGTLVQPNTAKRQKNIPKKVIKMFQKFKKGYIYFISLKKI